jgi:hypothetical protein
MPWHPLKKHSIVWSLLVCKLHALSNGRAWHRIKQWPELWNLQKWASLGWRNRVHLLKHPHQVQENHTHPGSPRTKDRWWESAKYEAAVATPATPKKPHSGGLICLYIMTVIMQSTSLPQQNSLIPSLASFQCPCPLKGWYTACPYNHM